MNKIEQQVLRLIGEDPASPDVFMDNKNDIAPIRDSINEAVQEIVMLNGGYKETFTIPLIASKMFYRLTFKDGFLGWVEDAWLANQKRRLNHTGIVDNSYYDPRWMITTATPEDYFMVGLDVIGFRPRPSATTDVVELTCVVIPDSFKEAIDRIKVRDSFQWAIINFAVSEYWASRGDAREASKHMQTYLDNVGFRQRFSVTQDRINQLSTLKSETPRQQKSIL